MPYDPLIADRLRNVLPNFELRPGEEIREIKMFSGLCFTLNKKMLIGVSSYPASQCSLAICVTHVMQLVAFRSSVVK